MLDILRTQVGVVGCYATGTALDALPIASDTVPCRVASDELLLVMPPATQPLNTRQVLAHFSSADPGALILDQSDGYSGFILRGDEAGGVFAQLSAVPLPAGTTAFVQGAFAGGAAKILAGASAILVLVPSTLRDHVVARLGDVCEGRAAVAAGESPLPEDWRQSPTFLNPGVLARPARS